MDEQHAAADVAGAGALRLLVVDDKPDVTDSLSLLLEILGHQVAVDNDGHAALARLACDSFDVCLLDLGMPRMDGLTLARRIRAMLPAPRPVLIAVTGYSEGSDRQAALDAGFDRVLVKPFSMESLTNMLGELSPEPACSG